MAALSRFQAALFVVISAATAADAFAPALSLPTRAARAGRCATPMRMGPGEMPKNKVVVTGLGAVTPIGTGASGFFEGLFAGKTALSKLPEWADEFPSNLAGQVGDFKAEEWYANKKEAKRQSRYMHFGIAASKLAVEDAKLEADSIKDRSRYGVLIGSAIGGSEYYEDAGIKWSRHSEYDELPDSAGETFAGRNSVYKGPLFMDDCKFTFEGFKKISPFIVPSFIMNSGSGVAAVELDAQGPNYCIGGYGGEGIAGAMSIAQAFRFLSTGVTDLMIAGGAEACLTKNVLAGFNQLPLTAKGGDENNINRAFDKQSSGFALSEAAGVMLMETEANAKARGAPVYCEVAGFGSAYGVELDEQLGLGAMPTADAVAAAITSALEVAGVKPEEVGFVSAHGTGVPAADAAELAGIKKAFGAHAGKLLVSSTRAQLGNAMAANSGLDALVCAKALRDGVVPGTARLEQAIDADLNLLPGQAKVEAKDLKVAVSTNVALGGQACAVVFKKS